jgi:hypothetical protein
MRSLVLVLVLAASGSAFASSAHDYSIPKIHHTSSSDKPQYVVLTFQNVSGQHRTIVVSGTSYAVPTDRELTLAMRVGTEVFVSSDQNRKISGVLVQASASDGQRFISVR